MNTTDMPAKPHLGRNIKRLREMLGIKQEALAIELGNDWTQRRISFLEGKEEIDDEILIEIAAALKISPEAIKNFSEEGTINVIQHNYEGSTLNHSPNYQYNYQCNFNPFEKIVQLYEEKMALYERMLKDRDMMIEQLKK